MLLSIGIVLAVVVNFGVALPVSAAILFPAAVWLVSRSLPSFLAALAASAVILFVHRDNVDKAIRGDDIRVRDWLRSQVARSN